MRQFFVALIVATFLVFSVQAQSPQAYTAPNVTLLPNHPLYKLQLVVDRISIVFLTNPYAKAQKYITLADRELTGAAKVIESEDFTTGLHSAFRGENYMTMFVNTIKGASYDSGSFNTELVNLAHRAFPYHQQVITMMIDKSSGDVQNQLRQILEFSQRNDSELTLLEQEYSVTDKK